MKHMLSLFTLVICYIIIYAQGEVNLRQKQFNLHNGVAIKGYDPVAYFRENKAVKGLKEIATYYDGVTYYFSTAHNRDEFKKNPRAYEPQYGGWCAYAMGAENEKVKVDPETFKIKDGKLYLFYNQNFNNTLPAWNKDESNLKMKADRNWGILFK